MTTVIVIIGILVLAFAGTAVGKKSHKDKQPVKYHYTRKDHLMTRAENEFFDVITQVVGTDYYVFPQVHLSEFLYHKVKGQSWEHALHYINQKSVDYLVCDKQRSPLLAIELDDWSHDSETRQRRDSNVSRILQEAGIPLLRFRDVRSMPNDEIASRIKDVLALSKTDSPIVAGT